MKRRPRGSIILGLVPYKQQDDTVCRGLYTEEWAMVQRAQQIDLKPVVEKQING